MDISVILNAEAGSLADKDAHSIADEICAAFQGAGHKCRSYICQGDTVPQTLEDAVKGVEALVVGGGDGTIRAAAYTALERGIALGVLPLGTMNLLAKDLNIPLELKDAVEALSRGQVKEIDVGIVNDRLFLNKVTLGVFVDLTKKREQARSDNRSIKWASLLAEMGIDIFTSKPILLTFDTGEKKLKLRTCAVVVSNNDFEDVVSLGLKRASVDKGVIALFITKHQSGWGFLNLVARSLLFGKFKDDPNLIKMLLKEVRISSPSGKITASVDGEIREMTSPLHFAIKPGALKVIVPRSS